MNGNYLILILIYDFNEKENKLEIVKFKKEIINGKKLKKKKLK
jgi:hypothetical protein